MVLSDISCGTMSLLVGWVYEECKESLSLEQYIALFQAAHKYNIKGLQMQCVRVLEGSVNSKTFRWIELMAASYKEDRLKQVRLSLSTA